jgi:hypothetical protein
VFSWWYEQILFDIVMVPLPCYGMMVNLYSSACCWFGAGDVDPLLDPAVSRLSFLLDIGLVFRMTFASLSYPSFMTS